MNPYARWLYVSLRMSFQEALCWTLDWAFFYQPPFNWVKARALNAFLGAHLADDCLVVHGVRAVNWRNVRLDRGGYLADGVNLRSQGMIRIGAWSTIGPQAMLASGGHATIDLAPTNSPITIGKGVFVGARALILEGVTIGDHAIIGAGAIVVGDVPALAIAVGNPARIVGYRDKPKRVWTVLGTIDLPTEIFEEVSHEMNV